MPLVSTRQVPYGFEALAALRELMGEIKRDDPLAPATVVVPTNIAGTVARRSLARGVDGHPGIAGLSVTTLPRLAERLAAGHLAPRRPATGPVLAAAWRSALATEPGVFEPVAGHSATAEALVAAHREFDELSGPTLAAVAGTSPLAADVVRLHRRVRASLGAGWYSPGDLMAVARPDPRAVAELGTVVLYLPQQLTPRASRFLMALAEACPVHLVLGRTGVLRADRPVLESLPSGWAPSAPAAAVTPPTAHEVITASDADDEVRLVVRRVLATLGSSPAHRVAVLFPAAEPYARLLHEHLAAAGVTVNGPGIRSVRERPLGRLLLELLELRQREFPRVDLFRALAHAPTFDLHGERVPLSRWESIAREAGVVGGTDWAKRLPAHADLLRVRRADLLDAQDRGEDEQDRRLERVGRQLDACAALGRFVTEVTGRLDHAALSQTWAVMAEQVTILLTDLVGPLDRALPVQEQYAATSILRALSELTSLDALGLQPDFGSLRDVLDLALASAAPRVGRFGEGVFVGPLSAAPGLDLDTLFLVGVAEDLLPGRLHEDALLSADVRAAANGELGAPLDDLHAIHRQFLVALQSASRAVVSFPRGDLRRSSARLPSRFLLPTLRELSGDHRLAATQWEDLEITELTSAPSFAGELRRTGILATEQEWRIRQALAEPDEARADPVVAASTTLLEARGSSAFTRFDGNLAGVEGRPDYADGELAVSPTALESYATCPHAFFVKRLLGVTPLEQPEDTVAISAIEIGNLVHQALDRLISQTADLPGPGQPWTPRHRARLLELAEELAAEFEARGLTGHHRLWARDRPRILATLAKALDVDDEWRAGLGARVLASELEFGPGKPVEAVAIPVTRGTVRFKGSADKVDVAADGTLLVTDVKTGSKRKFKGISEQDPVLAGTKLQLPVYAAAARRAHGQPDTRVTAAYWFVHKDEGRIGLPLTEDVLATFTACVEVLVESIAAGLFPLKAPEEADWGWVQCEYCNPDGVGHAAERARYQRKRSDPALAQLVALVDPKATHPAEEDA